MVQGVGFRMFVAEVAARRGISGWVRNLPDGAVEIQATATQDRLTELIDVVRQGPTGSRVDDMVTDIKETPAEHGEGFHIRSSEN